ncbi:conserved hypothetical protein [Ricinus communis]|uniref:F-box domain-containing protein n=1 Tax=Ricinus communis TaxID=3988 RepID=B9SR09_RICCO|nr:conserved hypothetical protein [Ricinus communis]
MAEWTNLPKDLLEQISKCFDTSIDILRFRSVCSSWRSSVSPKRRRLSGTFRILPNDGISCTSFGFYLTRRTIFLIGVPNSHNQTDPDGCDAGNLYMEKVVMIWLNYENENDFVLLTIHVSGKLAMFKSGDRRWTIIQDMPSPYDDVIVYKGNFYAVDNTGRTVIVRLNTELGLIANPVFGGDKKYLVESLGDLLLVDMYLSIDTAEGGLSFGEEFLEHLAQYMSERTVRFKVFKLDKEAQTWIEVKSLGDRVLFLGDDSTFSASVSDLSGCKGNCIFFVDNFFYSRDENLRANGGDDGVLAGRDIGVFDLETGCIGPLGNYPEYAKMFWPPPHWLLQHH